MPLPDATAIANLALDLIGEPYLSDLDTDTGETAACCRLHFTQTLETVLEGHVWSFAKRNLALVPYFHGASVVTSQFALRAVANDASGNLLTVEVNTDAALLVTLVDGISIRIQILYGTTTLAQMLAAIEASEEVSALVTCTLLADGATLVGTVATTQLAGGIDQQLIAPQWGSVFDLPDDCLRVCEVDGCDIDSPQRRFDIYGRYLVLRDARETPPDVTYITNAPPVPEWPTTFTEAVSLLLASKIAPKLIQNPQLANDLLGKHESALGKARSKDARETRSAENHGPRQLTARSSLVAARHGSPFSRGIGSACCQPSAPTDPHDTIPDLDAIFNQGQ